MNQKLLKELKIILKDEYQQDLNNRDVEIVGNQILSSFETLIKLRIDKNIDKWYIIVAYSMKHIIQSFLNLSSVMGGSADNFIFG